MESTFHLNALWEWMGECGSIHHQYPIRLLLPMLCRTLNTWTTIKLRQWWNSLWKEYSHKNSINLILWVIFLNFLMERTRKQKTTVLKSDTVFKINLKILLSMYLSVSKFTMISQFNGPYFIVQPAEFKICLYVSLPPVFEPWDIISH